MTTYYVDGTNGSDANNGSSSAPFQTIGATVSRVQPGDTVVVMPGAYFEEVTLVTDGTADAYITFKAFTPAKEIVKAHGVNHAVPPGGVLLHGREYGFNVRACYQRIEGFFVTADTRGSGIPIVVKSSDVPGKPFHHVEICDNVCFSGPQAGIATLAADYVFIRGNIAYQSASVSDWEGSGISICAHTNPSDCDAEAWHFIIEDNICYNNSNYSAGRRKKFNDPTTGFKGPGCTDGNGIIVDYGYNEPTGRTLVRNNILYNNGGRGIVITASGNVATINNTLYDNAWDPHFWGGYCEYAEVETGNDGSTFGRPGTIGRFKNIFVNNIVCSKANGETVHGSADALNARYLDYNCHFNGKTAAPGAHDVCDADPILTNPPPPVDDSRFIDRAGDYPLDVHHYFDVDFSLKDGSPCIGVGYTVGSDFAKPDEMTEEMAAELRYFLDKGLPEYDIYGNKRDPKKMDLGAVAYSTVSK